MATAFPSDKLVLSFKIISSHHAGQIKVTDANSLLENGLSKSHGFSKLQVAVFWQLGHPLPGMDFQPYYRIHRQRQFQTHIFGQWK